MDILLGFTVLFYINCFVYLWLAFISLKFRVAYLKPLDVTLKTFLDSLQFPLSYLFVKNNFFYNLTQSDNEIPRVKSLQASTLLGTIINRILIGSVAIMLPVANFWGSMREDIILLKIVGIIITIISSIVFIWAWRFGHQLKSIEAKLKSEHPES